jgi:hypothetical protein
MKMKFIKLKTKGGFDLLINTASITSVLGENDTGLSTIHLGGFGDDQDYYQVQATVDEIQAMIQEKEQQQ